LEEWIDAHQKRLRYAYDKAGARTNDRAEYRLTLTFQCEYSDLHSLLCIGHIALGILFLSSSDQFYLDIWLYKLCNFIILSMRNKLSCDLHIGRRQQIISFFKVKLLIVVFLCE
jgi:hypothetical protein